MKKTTILILLLALSLLVIGCTRNYAPTGYAAYPQQQNPQQNPYQGYYGGGCGVAPADDTGVEVGLVTTNL